MADISHVNLPGIAILLDTSFLPSASGASHRILVTVRLLSQLGFPVTVVHAWRGWSDPYLLAAEPFRTALFDPIDLYEASPALTNFLVSSGVEIVQTNEPSIAAALLGSNRLDSSIRMIFECHDLPAGVVGNYPATQVPTSQQRRLVPPLAPTSTCL